MPLPDPHILQTLERILQDKCDAGVLDASLREWPRDLWHALEAAGLTLAWVGDDAGGGGASLSDGFGIAQVSARYAAPVPLAETLLAGWLLEAGGIDVPGGVLTVASTGAHGHADRSADGGLSGKLERVPFARHAGHVVLAATDFVALMVSDDLTVEAGTAPSGEPHDDIALDNVRPAAVQPLEAAGEQAAVMGAVLRAVQIAGALEDILDRTVGYAQEREQFGRPISKFQAVQHNLAQLAGEVAAAVAASGAAVAAVERYGPTDVHAQFAAGAAKIRCGKAATEGAALAHQVHGAMGFAAEYPLHHYTRRLWTWRDDFGSETEWAEKVGAQVAAGGADAFWPTIAGG